MISKKVYSIFIGKHVIDSGLVTLSREPFFDGNEAIPYTSQTFPDVLAQIKVLADGKRIRVVLGEELVYVTELSFPSGTRVTRELVCERAEQSIPEDPRKTNWDFQTLRYAEKPKENEEILVQVAIVEKIFSDALRQALDTNPLSIESVLPESYVLASLENETRGVSVIVERDRERVILCAVEDGFAITTRVEENDMTTERLSLFLDFLLTHKKRKAERIIFSHFSEIGLEPFSIFSEEGYEIVVKDYNPLIGAALQKKISGKDEDVLNIDVFSSEKKSYWRFWA